MQFAEQLLGMQAHQFQYAGNRRGFAGMIADPEIPVLVHGQVTAVHGPQTDELYTQLIEA